MPDPCNVESCLAADSHAATVKMITGHPNRQFDGPKTKIIVLDMGLPCHSDPTRHRLTIAARAVPPPDSRERMGKSTPPVVNAGGRPPSDQTSFC